MPHEEGSAAQHAASSRTVSAMSSAKEAADSSASAVMDREEAAANPLIEDWDTPFGIPPFDRIRAEHFRPAFDQALAQRRQTVEAMVSSEEEPSFANTILALEHCQPLLDRVLEVFSNLTSTDLDEELRQLQTEINPRLVRESDAIVLDPRLYRRVQAVAEQQAKLDLDSADRRLLELTVSDLRRAGAALDQEAKERLSQVNERIAALTTQFSQNLLSETKGFELVIEDPADLQGLPEDVVGAARRSAQSAGLEKGWSFGLDRPSFEAFMTFSEKRDLRRQLYDAYRLRGAQGGEGDCRELLAEVVRLRAERAELLGYETHAHYQLETSMAETPERVEELLLRVWKPALHRARTELLAMQAIADREGAGHRLEGWDWWHYAEKLRRERYGLDEAELMPYFELRRVREGAFHVAGKLFGLRFQPLPDVPRWHPSVQAFEVQDRAGEHLGVILFDDFARPSKKGGAWMSTYREAGEIDGESVRPLVTNQTNLMEPGPGEPVLMRFSDVETLFHEFGHGLHGLMTRARHPRFAGTAGSPRDYVELPSQFMEHYALEPEVLAVYARHHQSNEVIPDELVQKLRRARTHNSGFATTEYVAAALVDLAWHRLSAAEAASVPDVQAFERQTLADLGLPEEIEPRYRSPYFAHVFSAPRGYSAGYYAYLWSAVLDTDAFAAFRERGNAFDPELAARLAEHIYEAGYVMPGKELYRRFRGADPSIEPLLEIRGLDPSSLEALGTTA